MLTFTASPGVRYIVRPDYERRPELQEFHAFEAPDRLALAHVDLESRCKFLSSYYGHPDAVFLVQGYIGGWLASLGPYRWLLRDVRCTNWGIKNAYTALDAWSLRLSWRYSAKNQIENTFGVTFTDRVQFAFLDEICT